MMRLNARLASLALAAGLTAAAALPAAADGAGNAPLYGFLGAHGEAERALEQRVDGAIDGADLDGWLRHLTAAPNHIGSAHNKANADFIAAQLRQFGWDVRIETFRVLVAYPDRQRFELLGAKPYAADFTEPAVEGDPDSAAKGVLPGMEAYSPDGEASAPLIYVNQGLSADYDELARQGLDAKGKIVLVRSSGAGRWVKPRLAEKHGAVGIVIFSDPIEDGYSKGDVYPKGAWRTPRTIQRGTLGIDDTLDAKAGARIQASRKLPGLSIPVATIGYGDAEVFLRALGGPQVPARWQGGLPFAYHIGGGAEARARLAVHSQWQWQTLYDVIATLRGSEQPDQWVLRGVHHDAWVLGAWDPLAGTTALLAEAKALGELYRQGVKPKRSLVFASWDGEELGILGSRAWADKHAEELRRKAVLYLNNDTTSRGYLSAAGNPALTRLVDGVAADIRDPETGASVGERLRARRAVVAAEKNAPAPAADPPLTPLGTGSDFVAFADHLGVPSLHLRYGYDRDGDEESVPVYHSLYDSYSHYQRFGDPGLKYIAALAKTDARLVLRAANADLLPWDYAAQAASLGKAIDALAAHNRSLGEKAKRRNALLDAHAYALAAVSWRGQGEPARLAADVPAIDLSALRTALRRLAASAAAYDEAYAKQAATDSPGAASLRRTNAALRAVEPSLLGEGLPGRPWYRHLLQAPSLQEGYDVATLPAIGDAIDQHRWDDARAAVARTAQAVDAAAAQLDAATVALRVP